MKPSSDTRSTMPKSNTASSAIGRSAPWAILRTPRCCRLSSNGMAHSLGVAQIAIPQTGERTPERIAYEKKDWFKKDQRFRNGIEGRISVVKRTVQLKR